jgi:hypothetical protein
VLDEEDEVTRERRRTSVGIAFQMHAGLHAAHDLDDPRRRVRRDGRRSCWQSVVLPPPEGAEMTISRLLGWMGLMTGSALSRAS